MLKASGYLWERNLFMKAYKGFNKDMTCRGFQYEEWKTYETNEAMCCETGFHACENPLDCFSYYGPNSSEYHEVECEGKIDRNHDLFTDSKFACTKIKIGGKISIFDMVNEFLEMRKKETNNNVSFSPRSVSDIFGSNQVSTSTETDGIAHVLGYNSISCSTRNHGIAYSMGDGSCSVSTEIQGISMVEGGGGISSATGELGSANLKGKFGVSCVTGTSGGASVENANCIAVAWGYDGRTKGVIGSYLVLADWGSNGFNDAQMVRVDGEKIKADTWYTMKDGVIVEAEG